MGSRSTETRTRRHPRRLQVLVGLLAISLVFAACSSSSSPSKSSTSSKSGTSSKTLTGSLTIGGLTDLGYAPLYLIEEEGWLQQEMPHVRTSFEFLSSGAAIESAVLSGHIDVAALGIAPFLLGWNSGINWKILTSFGPVNEDLVTWNPTIKTLRDVTSTDRIATLAPTSIQAIAIKKAALSLFGNANALDGNEVSLSHSVAYQAWLSHTISVDFSAVPFQDQEIAHGGHVVDTLFNIMGSTITPNVVAIKQSYYDSHKLEMTILYQTIQRALKMLSDHPRQSAALIAKAEHGGITEANVLGSIKNTSISWSAAPHGIAAYGNFMYQIHLMSKKLTSWKEVVFPNLYNVKGS